MMNHGLYPQIANTSTTPTISNQTTRQNQAASVDSYSYFLWFVPKLSISRFITSVTIWIMISQFSLFLVAILSSSLVSPLVNPTLGPSKCTLIEFGAKYSPFVIHKNEYWRIISASFIHSGFITLIVTLILEIILMFPIELEHGRVIIFVVFFLSGLTGYTFSCVANPTSIDTGALASCMGFVGFRLSRGILEWTGSQRPERRIGTVEGGSALIAMIVGQSNFVDNYGSFAGFVMGCFIGGGFFAAKIDAQQHSQRLVVAMSILAAIFVLFVCFFLLFAGSFPLINQLLWTSVCTSDQSFRLYDENFSEV